MKKLLTIAALATAAAAYADVEINLGSVGVTKVVSTSKNTIVATSYSELGGNGAGAIAVSNIIKTANLVKDTTKLYVLKPGASTYEGYTLRQVGDAGPKYWAKDTNYAVTAQGIGSGSASASATVPALNVGAGFWLACESAPTFYIYGMTPTSTNVTAAAGQTTLVGNPTQVTKAPSISGMQKGDKIMVFEGDSNFPTTYRTDGSTWSNLTNPSASGAGSKGEPTITAGTGFWYVSKGSAAVSINW